MIATMISEKKVKEGISIFSEYVTLKEQEKEIKEKIGDRKKADSLYSRVFDYIENNGSKDGSKNILKQDGYIFTVSATKELKNVAELEKILRKKKLLEKAQETVISKEKVEKLLKDGYLSEEEIYQDGYKKLTYKRDK